MLCYDIVTGRMHIVDEKRLKEIKEEIESKICQEKEVSLLEFLQMTTGCEKLDIADDFILTNIPSIHCDVNNDVAVINYSDSLAFNQKIYEEDL